ncbi:bifunctional aspartokinase/homoserine dehydrogenase, chloroplastic-like [Lactuca sativa]|uniref:bifunctional aspartokinase/homoserine dehydrogenase, chloroplastic-like n=1 Tax=Lactuca sativa TaxID=4236 RepID=UPI0022AF246E|nr:bifunctional aspartokinase/homoserine dehydrogenase, chloroplastic-like [Lactuca sativa]
MASTLDVSATLFNALAKANINVRAITQGCSEYNITIVVKNEDCVRALRAVHSRFYVSKASIAVGIIGPGLIGATLLNQLREHAAVLKENPTHIYVSWESLDQRKCC